MRDRIRDELEAAHRELTVQAQETLSHLYKRLLDTPVFRLADGTPAKVVGFINPRIDRDGDLSCGIDVILGEDRHLEFITRLGGWGRALDAERARPKSPRMR